MKYKFILMYILLFCLTGCKTKQSDDNLKSIELYKKGQDVYDQGEKFNVTGYKLRVDYDNEIRIVDVTIDMVRISLDKIGENTGTITYKDKIEKSISFTVTVNEVTDKVSSFNHFSRLEELSASYKLYNGDFEKGTLEGWYEEVENTFQVTGSSVDIWDNPVRKEGNYYLGLGKDNYNAEAEAKTGRLRSSLFRVGGTGLVSFKLGGSNSEHLKVSLMEYHKDSDDIEITKCNNVRYSLGNISGFIMIQYYYQFDMAKDKDMLVYFLIEDNATNSFGFINMDSINTYYESHDPIFVSDYCGFKEINYYQDIIGNAGSIISISTCETGKRVFELNEAFDASSLSVYATYEKNVCALLPKDQYIVDKHLFDSSKEGNYQINIQLKDSFINTSYNALVLKENEKLKGHISLTGTEKFLIIGDSLAQFWSTYKEDLAEINQIDNIGLGGSQISYWIDRIKNLPNKDYTHVICILGVNNVLSGGNTPEEINDLMEVLLNKLHQELPSAHIYLMTIFESPCTFVGTYQVVQKANIYYKNLASIRDYVSIVDCESLFIGSDTLPIEDKFIDGLHFKRDSYKEIASVIKKYFK